MSKDRKADTQSDTYGGKEIKPDQQQRLPHHMEMELPHELSINPLFAREGESTIPRFHLADGGCYQKQPIRSSMMKSLLMAMHA
jgi:glutamate decarboxylase